MYLNYQFVLSIIAFIRTNYRKSVLVVLNRIGNISEQNPYIWLIRTRCRWWGYCIITCDQTWSNSLSLNYIYIACYPVLVVSVWKFIPFDIVLSVCSIWTNMSIVVSHRYDSDVISCIRPN